MLAISACGALALPLALRHRRCLRCCAAGGLGVASVHPATAEQAEQELALANLQMQLDSTRDELSRLKYERAQAAAAAHADGAPLEGHASSIARMDGAMESLARREGTLVEKIGERMRNAGVDAGGATERTSRPA